MLINIRSLNSDFSVHDSSSYTWQLVEILVQYFICKDTFEHLNYMRHKKNKYQEQTAKNPKILIIVKITASGRFYPETCSRKLRTYS